ncbi:MAG: hypothetical protein ACRDRX_08500 [Pseudonocardiaceae bacterium]
MSITVKLWIRSVRLLGLQRTMQLAWRMTRMRHRQSLRAMKLAPEVPLLFAMGYLWKTRSNSLANGLRSWTRIVVALIGVEIALESMTPPIVLFLGSSEYDGFATMKRIRVEAACHVISLVDQASASILKHYREHYRGVMNGVRRSSRFNGVRLLQFYAPLADPTAPRADCIRTRTGHWRHTVLELMDCVPIVVLDARDAGRQIQQEALWMLAPGRSHKLVLITDDGEQVAPLVAELEKLGLALDGRSLRTVKASLAGKAIGVMTRCGSPLPRVTDIAGTVNLDANLADVEERFIQLGNAYLGLLQRVRAGSESDRALDADLSRLTDSAQTEPPYVTSSLDAALDFANNLLTRHAGEVSWRIDIMIDGSAVVSAGVQSRPGNMRVFESQKSDRTGPARAVLDVVMQALLA